MWTIWAGLTSRSPSSALALRPWPLGVALPTDGPGATPPACTPAGDLLDAGLDWWWSAWGDGAVPSPPTTPDSPATCATISGRRSAEDHQRVEPWFDWLPSRPRS